MATSSTIPTVKAAIVSVLQARATAGSTLDKVGISYAWEGNGPDAIFIGDLPTSDGFIPTIKAGKKARQEEYDLDVVFQSWRAAAGSDGGQAVEARCFAMYAELDDAMALDPKFGLGITVVQLAELTGVEVRLLPFEKGWQSELIAKVSVHARLT